MAVFHVSFFGLTKMNLAIFLSRDLAADELFEEELPVRNLQTVLRL